MVVRRYALALCAALILVADAAQSQSPDGVGQDRPLPFRVDLEPAEPLTLYPDYMTTSDSNSPLYWSKDRLFAFVSNGVPGGHSYRLDGENLDDLDGPRFVRIVGDLTPGVGKWIEAVHRDADGALFGWYHAEPDAPCGDPDQKLPFIGALVSHDNGNSWTDFGAVIEAPAGAHDCRMANGFFAGGVGDFSVLPDRNNRFLYFFFTNYDRDESQQGIAVARMPYEARHAPQQAVRKWHAGDWLERGLGGAATPIFPARRGWIHPDPDSFWGPAVHWNSHLEAYVMLLNRTAGGQSDWPQEGVYVTAARSLAFPTRWRVPQKIVDGGEWYPEIVGTDFGETDRMAGARARLFVSGYSEWEAVFSLDDKGPWSPAVRAARHKHGPRSHRVPAEQRMQFPSGG